jgi:hypothetical protein
MVLAYETLELVGMEPYMVVLPLLGVLMQADELNLVISLQVLAH